MKTKKGDADMLKQLRLLYAKANRITRMFHYCTVDVKLLLIKSYCTSFYCGYLWSDYKASTFSKLRVAFNNVYRRVLGLPQWSSASEMYVTHNIENFEEHLRKILYGFVQRLGCIMYNIYNFCITKREHFYIFFFDKTAAKVYSKTAAWRFSPCKYSTF